MQKIPLYKIIKCIVLIVVLLVGIIIATPVFTDIIGISITAIPGNIANEPTNFIIVLTSNTTARLSWTPGDNTTSSYIRLSLAGYPTSIDEGELLYSGNGSETYHVGVPFETTQVYYSLWGENTGNYSLQYLTGTIGGEGMIYLVLFMIPLGLTIAMFATKRMELGFPSLIFWAVSGAYCYTQYDTAWVDWQYYLMFASFGMAIFSSLAMYGLRDKKPTLGEIEDSNRYIDEGGNSGVQTGKFESVGEESEEKITKDDLFDMESSHKPSEREKQLNKRVKNRREGKRMSWNISKR